MQVHTYKTVMSLFVFYEKIFYIDSLQSYFHILGIFLGKERYVFLYFIGNM